MTTLVLVLLGGLLVGYFIGWLRGVKESERQMRRACMDSIMNGIGFVQDGKRVHPRRIFK